MKPQANVRGEDPRGHKVRDGLEACKPVVDRFLELVLVDPVVVRPDRSAFLAKGWGFESARKAGDFSDVVQFFAESFLKLLERPNVHRRNARPVTVFGGVV